MGAFKASAALVRVLFGFLPLAAIFNPVVLAQDTCDDEWLEYEDQCFYNSRVARSYEDCNAFCAAVGAEMPCIFHEDMNTFVTDSFENHQWIGLEDSDGDGIFTWTIKHCHSKFHMFHPNEPNRARSDELCIAIDHEGGDWNDRPCGPGPTCTCQKRRPVKALPRGDCFDQNSPNYRKCLPLHCGGLYYDGNPTCWHEDIAPHQIKYEYAFNPSLLTLSDHETQANAWNGHVASIETAEENAMMRPPISGLPTL